MSVNTKGVIELRKQTTKDVLYIVNTTRQALVDLRCRNIRMDCMGKSIFICFDYETEGRELSIYFGNNQNSCSSNDDVTFSFGKWGNYKMMKFILQYFHNDFNIYYLENDTNEDWEIFKEGKWEKLSKYRHV